MLNFPRHPASTRGDDARCCGAPNPVDEGHGEWPVVNNGVAGQIIGAYENLNLAIRAEDLYLPEHLNYIEF